MNANCGGCGGVTGQQRGAQWDDCYSHYIGNPKVGSLISANVGVNTFLQCSHLQSFCFFSM